MPHLSIPRAIGLATWSFGMVMTRSSSLTVVSRFIASINEGKANTVRQRLKEWYQEGKAKKGEKRDTLDVKSCFAPLLLWVISLLPVDCSRLALALDATSIGDRFTVLSLNVLVAGCGIPVAWRVVRATVAGSWRPYWQEMLESLRGTIPEHWQVIVLGKPGAK